MNIILIIYVHALLRIALIKYENNNFQNSIAVRNHPLMQRIRIHIQYIKELG